MSVSPRTVPQDGTTGCSLVSSERFDLRALAEPGEFNTPPVFAENPFQTTPRDAQTTHHPLITENAKKTFTSVTDDSHLTATRNTCNSLNSSNPSCPAMPDNLESSAGTHVIAKASRTYILQAPTSDAMEEFTLKTPSNNIEPRSKSLPQPTLLQEATSSKCAVSLRAIQDVPQDQPQESTASNSSVLKHSLPSKHSGLKSAASSNSYRPKLASDSDYSADTRGRSKSRGVMPTTQAQAQVADSSCSRGSLPSTTAQNSKRSCHSDSDEVQFLVEVPRRPVKKAKRRHNGQSRPSIDRIHRSRSSAKENPSLQLGTNTIKPPTAASQLSSIKENGKGVKSERLPEVDKAIPLKLSPPQLPEEPLTLAKPLVSLFEAPRVSAQKPINPPFQAAPRAPVSESSATSPSLDANSAPPSINAEQSLQSASPKRGRPKKDNSSTPSGRSAVTKPPRTQKKEKDMANLPSPSPKKPRKCGRATAAAKRQKLDDQPKPVAENGPEPAVAAAEDVSSHEIEPKGSYVTSMAGNGHQSPCIAVPWQPPDVSSGFIPTFAFPGLPFGYDWQQQTAQFYAQMYQNMQAPLQSSQFPSQHRFGRSSPVAQDVQRQTHQAQQLKNRARSPYGTIHTLKDAPPVSIQSMQVSNASQRRSSLYDVPPWPSSSVNMTNQVLSPTSQNLQQTTHSNLIPSPQSQEPSARGVQPTVQPARSPHPYNQPSPKVPNAAHSFSKLSTDMLVDIAETCQVTFPFAKIAERHNRPVQEVFDGFSAIIQIPLLKSAVNNRRATELASAKMEEFRKIKNGVSQLHEQELRQQRAAMMQVQNSHNQPMGLHPQLHHGHGHYPRYPPENRKT